MSNAAFSVAAIFNPMTSNHRLCNIVYLVFTLIQFALCATDNECSIYLAHILLTIRVFFRMLDYEGTRDLYDPIGNWYFLCASKLAGSYANIVMMIINFRINKTRLFVILLMVISCVYSIMVGIYGFEYVGGQKVVTFVVKFLSVYALGVF